MSSMMATAIAVHAVIMAGVLVEGFSVLKTRAASSGEFTF
jgi:hypothetical protein